MPPNPAKNWCFSVFDYGTTLLPEAQHNEIAYIVYQEEKCPTTGRNHLQGYLQLVSKKRLNGAKGILQVLFGGHPHLEVARGSPQENFEYCTKAETRVSGPYTMGKVADDCFVLFCQAIPPLELLHLFQTANLWCEIQQRL